MFGFVCYDVIFSLGFYFVTGLEFGEFGEFIGGAIEMAIGSWGEGWGWGRSLFFVSRLAYRRF